MATAAPPIPRIELANAPTPLLKLERLSREIGVELWVKRDDLTGLLESGNKVRKLEFLVGDALAQNADTLITCGTVQSNCCRAVSAVAARLGLRAILVLKGEPPRESDGNHLLDRLLGAEIHYCGEPEWQQIDDMLAELAARARRAGRIPYVIPESGATVVGALGYLVCGQEIASQIAHGAPDFDTIVITAFSGGSQAGLLMAKQLTGLRAEIVSIPIAWGAQRVRDYVADVVDQAQRRYGLPVEVPHEIPVLDGCQGAGRTEVRAAELETVVQLARQEGIVLDPVYTAKAFRGLLDSLRRSPGDLGQRVCFVHTGGIFSVFPFRRELGRLLEG
ncbi:MAG: D-cysteine desulfhydrase family protein [Candidatus Rokuibacteriota bacterium]